MPRKLSKVEEEDLETDIFDSDAEEDLPEEKEPPQPEQESSSHTLIPMDMFTITAEFPKEDYVVSHISGSQIKYSDAANFGIGFFRLIEMMLGFTGGDSSPRPHGKGPNYLKITCPNCKQVTVTVAPHVDKHCSGCGGVLPSPVTFTPAETRNAWSDGDNDSIEAEFVSEEDLNV